MSLATQKSEPDKYYQYYLSHRHSFDGNACSEKLSGFNKVYTLNDYTPKATLYKYIRYSYLESSINKSTITFVSPQLWEDPFERRFLLTDYSSLNFHQPELACLCLTSDDINNEEAAWRLYAPHPDEKLLRISIDTNYLLKQLDQFAIDNNCSVYLAAANYEFYRKEIENLHKEDPDDFHSQFFPKSKFNIACFLSLMSLKRKAFSYENEVRIFICNNNEQSLFTNEDFLLNVSFDFSKGLKGITIGPLRPFPKSDPRFDIYTKLCNIENEHVAKKIRKMLPDVIVHSSTIYISDNLKEL